MPQTILFVDEEQFVLKALQRSFRRMRNAWDMRFAATPGEALQALAAEPSDVLVTETVFKDQSGLDLLHTVRERYPQIVRIILSGYADRDVLMKSVDLAHQYLAKPCEDDTLKATIARAFMMKELLDQEALKKVVARIDSLPSLPALYIELVEELESEDASIQKVGDIIAKDLGLTTKILKLVNSSFFGIPQHISNPAKAVSLLGLDLIQAIVLTSGTFAKFKDLKFEGFSLKQMWEHAMTVAAFSKTIAQHVGLDRKTTETAFMAGMLHDVGKLLIAAHLPEHFGCILKYMKDQAVGMATAEIEIVGTTHAAIGAYLLGLWGLPDPIIDAAAFHHVPAAKTSDQVGTLLITHVADALANSCNDLQNPQVAIGGLDYLTLERMHLLASLDQWRRACAAHIESGSA